MTPQETVGPQTVNHVGELPAVSISFGLRPGVSLGAAVDHINRVAAGLLPPTVTTTFQGSAKTFQQSMTNLGLLLFIAIGVVYIVLGMLYESYIHPLTILSGLPSAGLGALVTLYLFGDELNIYSFVGLVMLVGIVKKNAIMQIDFALEAERQHGKSPADAIYEGCLIRFRPIMMTTMAALLGAVPIALGFGAGGEARRPLGLGGRRRTDRLAADHAVPDAGRLHLHGGYPASFSIRVHCASVTGITDNREILTRSKSLNQGSALISLSVTGRASFFTGPMSTTCALPVASSGSG